MSDNNKTINEVKQQILNNIFSTDNGQSALAFAQAYGVLVSAEEVEKQTNPDDSQKGMIAKTRRQVKENQ